MPIEDIRRIFTPEQKTTIRSTAAYSSQIVWGFLEGSSHKWVRKEAINAEIAKTEQLAQEFFRLIIPHQPETRLAYDSRQDTYYILSQEVSGYQSLPLHQETHFLNGSYRGLGQAVVCAMFVQEIDLKNGNIGLNDHHQVTKIDGDWSFAEKRCPNAYQFDISPESIAHLPYPVDFYTFNWLDIACEGVYLAESDIINPDIVNNTLFRSEVNQAIHNICLLPDSYIGALINVQEISNDFADLLKERRDILRNSALQNASFKDYLHSPQAQEHRIDFFTYLDAFTTNGSRLSCNPLDFKWQQAYLDHKSNADFLDSLGALLNKIITNVQIRDQYMLEAYIIEMKSSILKNIDDRGQLSVIKKELREIVDNININPNLVVNSISSSFLDSWNKANDAQAVQIEEPQKKGSYYSRFKTRLGNLIRGKEPSQDSDNTPSKKP